MIRQIWYAEDEEFIIDCIVIGKNCTDRHGIIVTGVLKIGPADTYLNGRPLTKSLTSTDYFNMAEEHLIPLSKEDRKYYYEKYPEHIL